MPQLNELIKISGLKKKHIIERLGISAPTFQKRIEDPGTFRAKELMILEEILGEKIDIK